MAFVAGGEKTGFCRRTFLEAFRQSGLNETASGKLLLKMIGCKPKREELIGG